NITNFSSQSYYYCLYHQYLYTTPTRRSSDLRRIAVVCQAICSGRWRRKLSSGKSLHTPATWSASKPSAASSASARSRHTRTRARSEEHTSELQSRFDLVCRLLLEKKNNILKI